MRENIGGGRERSIEIFVRTIIHVKPASHQRIFFAPIISQTIINPRRIKFVPDGIDRMRCELRVRSRRVNRRGYIIEFRADIFRVGERILRD